MSQALPQRTHTYSKKRGTVQSTPNSSPDATISTNSNSNQPHIEVNNAKSATESVGKENSAPNTSNSTITEPLRAVDPSNTSTVPPVQDTNKSNGSTNTNSVGVPRQPAAGRGPNTVAKKNPPVGDADDASANPGIESQSNQQTTNSTAPANASTHSDPESATTQQLPVPKISKAAAKRARKQQLEAANSLPYTTTTLSGPNSNKNTSSATTGVVCNLIYIAARC